MDRENNGAHARSWPEHNDEPNLHEYGGEILVGNSVGMADEFIIEVGREIPDERYRNADNASSVQRWERAQ